MDMTQMSNRFGSFENWPDQSLAPEELASQGFFYQGQHDEIHCAYCGYIMGDWVNSRYKPYYRHRLARPDCVRAMEESGSRKHIPHSPAMKDYKTRFATYAEWPANKHQQPRDMAAAGFYYEGRDDCVRCFHCGGALYAWDKDDVPWEEHAWTYPKCPYLVQTKGSTFINDVRKKRQEAETTCCGLTRKAQAPTTSEDPKEKLRCKVCYENDSGNHVQTMWSFSLLCKMFKQAAVVSDLSGCHFP
ncbi:E3 ubiquitin-protein ligase XIAP-like [Paramacrobiotus metropolitanus]|uniref:E3 ubiquitin-protein ligase XIAP-like n=1 Tax=Paramacrobiotus metropolitanus TaxID=2943436 RepID=UPI002445ED80|nr:E3 ubiquitin-protein ligase XIAP-like [Paramacrobiotus metropolitanus]